MLPALAQHDPLRGAWEGAIDPQELDLRITATFEGGRGDYEGALDVPLHGATRLALTDVALTDEGAVTVEVPALPGDARFGLRREDGGLVGTFQQDEVVFPVRFERDGRPAPGRIRRAPRRRELPSRTSRRT